MKNWVNALGETVEQTATGLRVAGNSNRRIVMAFTPASLEREEESFMAPANHTATPARAATERPATARPSQQPPTEDVSLFDEFVAEADPEERFMAPTPYTAK